MNAWQDAEDHAERAHQHFRAGEWERALSELTAALDGRPDRSEWHVGMGLTLDALERYREAADSYHAAIEHGGEHPALLLHLGIDLVRCGDSERAIETLDRLNQLDPLREVGYVNRILAYAMLGRHDEAELMFYLANDVARDADQDDAIPAALAGAGGPTARAAAHDYLAQSLLLRRPADPDRALWCWQEALRHDPRHPSAHLQLARLQRLRNHTTRAAEHFRAHLNVKPDDNPARLAFADLLREAGRTAPAGEQYRQALRRDPGLAVAHLRLGELALASGHPNAARDRFRRARALDARLPGVHLGLAAAALARGQRNRALRRVHEALAIPGHNAAQTVNAADLLIRLNDFTDAAGLLDRLLNPDAPEADPASPHAGPRSELARDNRLRSVALRHRGVALLADGQITRALADLRGCVRLNPLDLTALTHLSRQALNAGDLTAAAHWLARGHAVTPGHADLRGLKRRHHWLRICRALRWPARPRPVAMPRPTV